MKPTPGGPPSGPLESDYKNPVGVTPDILSNHINQIGKNSGGIKELATKVDELVDIIKSCPHCLKKLEE
ncbi:hypothetical protein LCGC14_1007630 [marine sediment metagenome]|uniref:Uncharacterized protein n=1 Tax=marine sediment metagenome TaxID=412755 RepID=A0A0F9N1D0_9ZZZZ